MPERYSRKRIQSALDRIEQQEAGWQAALAGRSVLKLSYEQLVQDKLGTLQACLAWLSVDADSVALPSDGLRKQSDGVSAEWKRRFQRDT
jgi:LPS sulfotransferase NodH